MNKCSETVVVGTSTVTLLIASASWSCCRVKICYVERLHANFNLGTECSSIDRSVGIVHSRNKAKGFVHTPQNEARAFNIYNTNCPFSTIFVDNSLQADILINNFIILIL
jgi:hypothetical protein